MALLTDYDPLSQCGAGVNRCTRKSISVHTRNGSVRLGR